MNRTSKSIRTGLIAVALLLGACALSPQVVPIRPALEPAGGTAALSSVALEVNDLRRDAVVGYRGGVYSTASISTAPDATAAVRSELARVLGARGLNVLEPGSAADVKLSVELVELRYAARQDKFKWIIETSAAVRARAERGDITRTGDYRDRRTRELIKAPSVQDNVELVNAVLGAALQRLVADPELLRF